MAGLAWSATQRKETWHDCTLPGSSKPKHAVSCKLRQPVMEMAEWQAWRDGISSMAAGQQGTRSPVDGARGKPPRYLAPEG